MESISMSVNSSSSLGNFEEEKKDFCSVLRTTLWGKRPLMLDLCSRTFLLSSVVSSAETLRLWPEPWRPSANRYRTWQKPSNCCMVKLQMPTNNELKTLLLLHSKQELWRWLMTSLWSARGSWSLLWHDENLPVRVPLFSFLTVTQQLLKH